MTKEESISLSARIGKIIAENAPRVRYTADELATELATFGKEDLAEMKELGLYDGNFEKFYVIREFCADLGLSQVADGDYILRLFEASRMLDHKAFRSDPYMKVLESLPARSGRFTLMPSGYAKGEIFAYDMPDFSEDIVVPKLGFFNRPVSFPTLYEGDKPWMSICPSEINSMEMPIRAARGRVLVLGLGLGYYAYSVAQNPLVESVTVVELCPDVVKLFREHISPCLDFKGKLKVITADAFDYLDSLTGGEYDFCFADIWEGAVDGAVCYQKLLPHTYRLASTEFSYWIEDSILAYLKE